MIEQITMYRCVCDNCGHQWGDDVIAYADPANTWDCAANEGWNKHEDKTYCPDCWSYDDNDNLIIREFNQQK